MISRFFIERPVLANVIAVLLVLLGSIAIALLPVNQYPSIVPPTIQVTTSYPGADSKTLISTVIAIKGGGAILHGLKLVLSG